MGNDVEEHEGIELEGLDGLEDLAAVTRRGLLVKGGLAAAGLAALGAPATALAAAGRATKSVSIAVVTHGQASDPFWSVVKNGVDAGAKAMGAKVTYNAPATFDLVAMSRLIDAAVARKPAGLVVSIPDVKPLSKSIKSAVSKGVAVISINSGSDVFKSVGALTHVGQTELIAGQGGGARMAAAGVRNAICVNQEVGNVALDLRCKGFGQSLAKAGGKSKVLAVDLKDPTAAQQKIEGALRADSKVDAVFTLGPTGATPALKALQKLGKIGKVKAATFDLSPDVLTAISKGQMLFAIDQQQYLQGYLPIVFLHLYANYLLVPGGGLPVLTGPGFVEKSTASKVLALSKQGIR
jgi:simple sugar transport system substrate-binding protein